MTNTEELDKVIIIIYNIKGPALKNLPFINNSVYGDILCIEEQVFPNEPSTIYYV
jgi:hypothetical protein